MDRCFAEKMRQTIEKKEEKVCVSDKLGPSRAAVQRIR